jgi:transposase-like protein
MAHPGGRPTDYKPEYCQRVIDLMHGGMYIYEVAAELDVSRETLYAWARTHPEFSDAFKLAKERCKAWWVSQARKNLHKKSFNNTLYIFYMKSQFNFSDAKTFLPIPLEGDTPIEMLNDLIKKFAKGLISVQDAKMSADTFKVLLDDEDRKKLDELYEIITKHEGS